MIKRTTLALLALCGSAHAELLQYSPSIASTITAIPLPQEQGGTGLSTIGAANQCLQVNGAGTALQYASCGGTADLILGTATSSTAPYRSGDLTTGLYTAGAGEVDFSSAGVKVGAFNGSGLTLPLISGSTQCLHVSSAGLISGTGSDCGAGGGSGTVTSVATNNGLTGGTITTTGTLGLASISANQLLGALTATYPSGLSVPSCSTASSALTWTSGSGFGCNSITGGGSMAIGGTVTSGVANRVTFINPTATLAQSASLTFDDATKILGVNGVNAVWQDATNYNTGFGNTNLPATISQTGGAPNGQYDTALGYHALNANTTGYANAAVGSNALPSNTTGAFNLCFGHTACFANTTGDNNTAIGASALEYSTTASSNTAVGNSS